MTSTIRFLLLVILLVLTAAFLVANAGPTSAAPDYTVSVAPSATELPAGGEAVFAVSLSGQLASYPSFDYAVDGGTLVGVVAMKATGPASAEGAVHVTRADAGLARLTVSFAGRALAFSEARFSAMGEVAVRVQLVAGIDAAARTWRFEVMNSSNQLVATLSAGTSGDAPVASVATRALPYGYYSVRQVLGGDTATACTGNAFYEVVAPAGAATTIELASAKAEAAFEIRPCDALPGDLQVNIPIDTVAPGSSGPGAIGDPDFLPGDAPISEVRGARQPGAAPLPPRTGNSAPAQPSEAGLPLFAGLALLGLSAAAAPLARRRHAKR